MWCHFLISIKLLCISTHSRTPSSRFNNHLLGLNGKMVEQYIINDTLFFVSSNKQNWNNSFSADRIFECYAFTTFNAIKAILLFSNWRNSHVFFLCNFNHRKLLMDHQICTFTFISIAMKLVCHPFSVPSIPNEYLRRFVWNQSRTKTSFNLHNLQRKQLNIFVTMYFISNGFETWKQNKQQSIKKQTQSHRSACSTLFIRFIVLTNSNIKEYILKADFV